MLKKISKSFGISVINEPSPQKLVPPSESSVESPSTAILIDSIHEECPPGISDPAPSTSTTGRVTRNTRNYNSGQEKTSQSSTAASSNPPASRFFTRKRKVPVAEKIPSFAPQDNQPDQSSALNLS